MFEKLCLDFTEDFKEVWIPLIRSCFGEYNVIITDNLSDRTKMIKSEIKEREISFVMHVVKFPHQRGETRRDREFGALMGKEEESRKGVMEGRTGVRTLY